MPQGDTFTQAGHFKAAGAHDRNSLLLLLLLPHRSTRKRRGLVIGSPPHARSPSVRAEGSTVTARDASSSARSRAPLGVLRCDARHGSTRPRSLVGSSCSQPPRGLG